MSNNIIQLDLYNWNVNGMRDKHKSALIRRQMFRDQGIYLLQETHELKPRQIEAYKNAVPFCYTKNSERHTKGVHSSLPQRNSHLNHFPSTINLNDNNSNLLIAKIQWFNLQILLVNVYALATEQHNERSHFSMSYF
jgi:exonuclease III